MRLKNGFFGLFCWIVVILMVWWDCFDEVVFVVGFVFAAASKKFIIVFVFWKYFVLEVVFIGVGVLIDIFKMVFIFLLLLLLLLFNKVSDFGVENFFVYWILMFFFTCVSKVSGYFKLMILWLILLMICIVCMLWLVLLNLCVFLFKVCLSFF